MFRRTILIAVCVIGGLGGWTHMVAADASLLNALNSAETWKNCDAPLPGLAVLAQYDDKGDGSPQIPAAFKPYVGKWRGVWENTLADRPMCAYLFISYDRAKTNMIALYVNGSAPWVEAKAVTMSVKLGNDGLDLLDHEGEVYFHFILSDGKLEGLHLRSKSKGLFDRTTLTAAQ